MLTIERKIELATDTLRMMRDNLMVAVMEDNKKAVKNIKASMKRKEEQIKRYMKEAK